MSNVIAQLHFRPCSMAHSSLRLLSSSMHSQLDSLSRNGHSRTSVLFCLTGAVTSSQLDDGGGGLSGSDIRGSDRCEDFNIALN